MSEDRFSRRDHEQMDSERNACGNSCESDGQEGRHVDHPLVVTRNLQAGGAHSDVVDSRE